MVKLELNLPWKPVLAWPWGVKYYIDPKTYLITSHQESWDIAPWEVRLLQYGRYIFPNTTPYSTMRVITHA
jgi:hypothetical protein